MLFLIQKEERYQDLDLETMIVKDLIEHNKYMHEYIFRSVNDFGENVCYPQKMDIKNAIPVGTIDYVGSYLKYIHGIKNMNPIEIPECLRTDEFLKRDYKIVTYDKVPKKGRWFVKDASQLKRFAYVGDMQFVIHDKIWEEDTKNKCILYLDKAHLFQVSEEIDILSEYRLYFIDGQLQAMSHYNGDPWLLPDIELLKKANLIYSIQDDYPKSFTMDIAITSRGTCLLEIHPFMCVGLYNALWGDNLLYAYRDGIDYYERFNTPIKEWNNN